MVFAPGQSLQKGNYTIESELGRGRFSITYLARRNDGERWVIKVLDPQVLVGLSGEERDRLEDKLWQEGFKLAKCRDTRHIVKVGEPFREGKVICLPLEYADGKSLADRGQRVLVESTALEYVQQIGEALAVVHGQGLVHCDIRPANIFLRIRDNQVEAVLADFGLSLDFDAVLSRTRTRERMDGFSPPELYSRGRPVGPYTDVYSLAATLYELLTGEVPVSVDERRDGPELVSPRSKNPEISGPTTRAILKGMELLPEKRPQSVADWLELLKSEKLKSEPVSPGTPKREVNWNKWGVIVAVLGVVVALVVGIPAWIELNSSKPSPPASNAKPSP